MLPNEFLKSALPLVQMSKGDRILVGFLPPPYCDLVLDFRAASTPESPTREPMVASLYCMENQDIVLMVKSSSAVVLLDGREVPPSLNEVCCPPGSLLVFGEEPHDTSFLLVPAMEPLSQEDYGFDPTSTCLLGKDVIPIAPPSDDDEVRRDDSSWRWLPAAQKKVEEARRPAPKEAATKVPVKAAKTVGFTLPTAKEEKKTGKVVKKKTVLKAPTRI